MFLKRIGAAVAALCALMVVGVAPASASFEHLLYSGGSAVAPGTAIEGTNVGNFKFTAGEPEGPTIFECSGASLAGTVLNNTGSAVNVNLESGAFTGPGLENKCSTPAGNLAITWEMPGCLRHSIAMPTGQWQMRGSLCSVEATNLAFTVTSTFGTCRYSRGEVIKLNGALNTSPLDLKVAAGPFEGKGTGCVYGSLGFHGTYRLKTGAGAELSLVG